MKSASPLQTDRHHIGREGEAGADLATGVGVFSREDLAEGCAGYRCGLKGRVAEAVDMPLIQ